jgi:hypothetical protein
MKMSMPISSAGAVVSLTFVLAGCDAKAGSAYQGESLMSLQGRVVIDNSDPPAELVPALAFVDRTATYHILDVEVRGEFPSDFQLDVLDPPPEAAFLAPRDSFPDATERDPRYAHGYLSAVAPQHPDKVPVVLQSIQGDRCDGPTSRTAEPGAPWSVSTEPGFSCYRQFKACTGDNKECYEKEERCDHNFENCEIVRASGSLDLLDRVADNFAGIAPGYLVLYLEGRAEAGTAVARVFGRGKPLAAGYHLLKVTEPVNGDDDTDDSDDAAIIAAVEQCLNNAEARVVSEYNRINGTNFDDINELPRIRMEAPPPEPPMDGSFGDFDTTGFYDEVDEARALAIAELDCESLAIVREPLPRPYDKLSLTIGQALETRFPTGVL